MMGTRVGSGCVEQRGILIPALGFKKLSLAWTWVKFVQWTQGDLGDPEPMAGHVNGCLCASLEPAPVRESVAPGRCCVAWDDVV